MDFRLDPRPKNASDHVRHPEVDPESTHYDPPSSVDGQLNFNNSIGPTPLSLPSSLGFASQLPGLLGAYEDRYDVSIVMSASFLPPSNSSDTFNELSESFSGTLSSSTGLTYPSPGYRKEIGECQPQRLVNDQIHLQSNPYAHPKFLNFPQYGNDHSLFDNAVEAPSALWSYGPPTEISSSTGYGTGFIGPSNGLAGLEQSDSQNSTHNPVASPQFWDPRRPQIKGPLYSNSSNSGVESQQHEPRRQTKYVIVPVEGCDSMKSDATEYCTAGIDVPSLVVADYPSGNTFNFSQSAARSVRPIAQNSQLVSNGPPYSFQNPWDGMPCIDRTTSAANFAKDIRGDQTHCHEYFAGGLGTSIVVQIPSEQLQNQRKRRPSSETPLQNPGKRWRTIAPNPVAESSTSNYANATNDKTDIPSERRQTQETSGEQDMPSKRVRINLNAKNCSLCRYNRIGSCTGRTASTRCIYCQRRYNKIIRKSTLEQAFDFQLEVFLDQDLKHLFARLRSELVQSQETNDEASHQIIICHLEPHLGFPCPIQYSEHSHCIPMKRMLWAFGPDNTFLNHPVFDTSKMQEFMMSSILTMYPTKFHNANRGIISTSLQCSTWITILFNMEHNRIYLGRDFAAHEAIELVVETLHSIVYTVQDLFTTLEKEVREAARSIGSDNPEVLCAVMALFTAINANKNVIQSSSDGLRIMDEFWQQVKSRAEKISSCLKRVREAYGVSCCMGVNLNLQRHVELVDLQSRFKPAINITFERYQVAPPSHPHSATPKGRTFLEVLQATSPDYEEAAESPSPPVLEYDGLERGELDHDDLEHDDLEHDEEEHDEEEHDEEEHDEQEDVEHAELPRAQMPTEASLRKLATLPSQWVPPQNSPRKSISLDMEIEIKEHKTDSSCPPRNAVGRDDPNFYLRGVGSGRESHPEFCPPRHLDDSDL